MNTPTLFGKFALNSPPLRAFFALLTILVGLGSSPVFGQTSSIISPRFVRVTTNTTGPVEYEATNNNPDGGGAVGTQFDEFNFGTFNFSTDQLVLNGGTFSVAETGSETYTEGFVDFVVFPGTLGPSNTPPRPALTAANSGTVRLTQISFDPSTRIRTFAISPTAGATIAADILAKATAGGAGTNYRFDTRFRAEGTGINADGDEVTRSLPSGFRRSQFTATGTPPPREGPAASVLQSRTVTLTNRNGVGGNQPASTSPITLNAAPATAGSGNFQGSNFGAFDVNTGDLLLNGGQIEIQLAPGEDFTSAVLDYRVSQFVNGSVTTTSPFQSIELQPVVFTNADGTTTTTVNGVRTFRLTTQQINLIQLAEGVAGQQDFRIDLRPTAFGTDASGNILTLGGASRSATFTIVGPVPAPALTTQWLGTGNDNWYLDSNWSNGRPTSNTNAIVPDFGSELAGAVYPNITIAGAAAAGVPGVPAMCRDLVLGGSTQAQRSICRLVSGRLQVYGDFSNRLASFIQRGDGNEIPVLEFAGTRLKTVSSGTFTKVEISGSGDITVVNRILIQTELRFLPGSGNIITDISDPDRSFVELADRNASAPDGAQLVGERETKLAGEPQEKVRGFVLTNRANVTVAENEARTFGNIGMELDFVSGEDPGNIVVTRNTAENYAPVVGRFGIRRIFGVRPSQPGSQFAITTANMRFFYLDGETVRLKTSPPTESSPSTADGDGTLDEEKLTIFLSTNSGNSFRNLGRSQPVDVVGPNGTGGSVYKEGVNSFATFTLSDGSNENVGLPLPVVLSAFDVKRAGADAVLTWTTSSEKNSTLR